MGGKLSHGPCGPCERGLRGRRVYAGSGSAPPTRGSWEKRSGRAGGCWAPNPRPRGWAAGAVPALSAGFVSCRFPSPEPASPWVLGAGRGADAGKSRPGPGAARGSRAGRTAASRRPQMTTRGSTFAPDGGAGAPAWSGSGAGWGGGAGGVAMSPPGGSGGCASRVPGRSPSAWPRVHTPFGALLRSDPLSFVWCISVLACQLLLLLP